MTKKKLRKTNWLPSLSLPDWLILFPSFFRTKRQLVTCKHSDHVTFRFSCSYIHNQNKKDNRHRTATTKIVSDKQTLVSPFRFPLLNNKSHCITVWTVSWDLAFAFVVLLSFLRRPDVLWSRRLTSKLHEEGKSSSEFQRQDVDITTCSTCQSLLTCSYPNHSVLMLVNAISQSTDTMRTTIPVSGAAKMRYGLEGMHYDFFSPYLDLNWHIDWINPRRMSLAAAALSASSLLFFSSLLFLRQPFFSFRRKNLQSASFFRNNGCSYFLPSKWYTKHSTVWYLSLFSEASRILDQWIARDGSDRLLSSDWLCGQQNDRML